MADYPLSEGAFVPGGRWLDHTVHTFVLDADGVTASFVLSRVTPPEGVAHKEYAASELHRMSHTLKDYALVHRGAIEIDGTVTDLIESRWTSAHGPVDQLLAYLPAGGRLLLMTGTSPAPIPPGVRQQILMMMASFRAARA
jgi:hypothetical protein